MRKTDIFGIILLAVVLMTACGNDLKVDCGTLNPNDIEIILSAGIPMRLNDSPTIIYKDGICYDIPNEYGENDWAINYKGQKQCAFRHFKTNCRHSHKYNFSFFGNHDTIYCIIDIRGKDAKKDTLIFKELENNKYNQLDSNGLKQGIWLSETPSDRVETNYYNGKRHGIYIAYSRKSNKISSIGEFRNNAMSGTWYTFDDYGILLSKVENIVENNDYYYFADGTYYYGGKPKHKAHYVNYYPNGNIKSEGTILFSDTFETESSEYGFWKYYDEKGNLIKTEEIEGVKKK